VEAALTRLDILLLHGAKRPDGSSTAGGIEDVALHLATDLGDPRLVPLAFTLSRDSSPVVRTRTATFLGTVGGTEAVDVLAELLKDESAQVRAAAANAFGRLGYWPAASSVASLLNDDTHMVRQEAGLALSRLGASGILLLRRAQSRDPNLASDLAPQGDSVHE